MDDTVRVLEWARHFKQAGRLQGKPESLDLIRSEDGIGQATFVFQGQEDEAACRTRPLAYDDVACETNGLSVRDLVQIGCFLEPSFFECGSQVVHDLGASRESGESVVGEGLFQS